MPLTFKEFLTDATPKAAEELETALLRLPEDKRNWSPMGAARTAADMAAECAILTGSTVEMIGTRVFPPDFDPETFGREKAGLAQDTGALFALLRANTERFVAAVRDVPDEDMDVEIPMPWGPVKMKGLLSYPYWNMSYHLGQINYLASMLGCLD